jgi:hypothetical protein
VTEGGCAGAINPVFFPSCFAKNGGLSKPGKPDVQESGEMPDCIGEYRICVAPANCLSEAGTIKKALSGGTRLLAWIGLGGKNRLPGGFAGLRLQGRDVDANRSGKVFYDQCQFLTVVSYKRRTAGKSQHTTIFFQIFFGGYFLLRNDDFVKGDGIAPAGSYFCLLKHERLCKQS